MLNFEATLDSGLMECITSCSSHAISTTAAPAEVVGSMGLLTAVEGTSVCHPQDGEPE